MNNGINLKIKYTVTPASTHFLHFRGAWVIQNPSVLPEHVWNRWLQCASQSTLIWTTQPAYANRIFATRCQQIWDAEPSDSGTGPMWGHRSVDLSHGHLRVLLQTHKQSCEHKLIFQKFKMWFLLLRLGLFRKKWVIRALTPPSPFSAITTTLLLALKNVFLVFLVPSFSNVKLPFLFPTNSPVYFACQM